MLNEWSDRQPDPEKPSRLIRGVVAIAILLSASVMIYQGLAALAGF